MRENRIKVKQKRDWNLKRVMTLQLLKPIWLYKIRWYIIQSSGGEIFINYWIQSNLKIRPGQSFKRLASIISANSSHLKVGRSYIKLVVERVWFWRERKKEKSLLLFSVIVAINNRSVSHNHFHSSLGWRGGRVLSLKHYMAREASAGTCYH